MSDQTRVIIFATPTPIAHDIEKELEVDIQGFLQKWKSHEKDVVAKAEVLYSHFIKFTIPNIKENNPSGCSLDQLTHFIQFVSKKYDLDFMDRKKLYYSEKNKVKSLDFHELQDYFDTKKISGTTLFFNILIENEESFDKSFQIQFTQSPYFKLLEKE